MTDSTENILAICKGLRENIGIIANNLVKANKRIEVLEKDAHAPVDFTPYIKRIEELEYDVLKLKLGTI